MSTSSVDFSLLGEFLRDMRKAEGLSQLQAAQKVPCSSTYLSRIERGSRPSLELLIRFADIYHLSIDDMLYLSNRSCNNLVELLKVILSLPKDDPNYMSALMEQFAQYGHVDGAEASEPEK